MQSCSKLDRRDDGPPVFAWYILKKKKGRIVTLALFLQKTGEHRDLEQPRQL